MRLLALTLALAALPAIATEYPLWNGEPIEEYAKKVGLPPTKTLDLGNGVTMEFVLIPAGKFVMGTEVPRPVDEAAYRSKILTGRVVLAVGGGLLVILLGLVLVRAIRKRQRPQYSLAWFLAMAVAAGIGLMGGLHWYFSARALADAQREYQTAMARFTPYVECETPAHEVTIGTPYYIAKFEVTQEQYNRVMEHNPSNFEGRNQPTEFVSWDGARGFCEKTSDRTGFVVRLPTEAEWEHACRAGTRTKYCSGDLETDLHRVAWFEGNSGMRTHPVGQKTANAWGVYDMHGNVYEMCEDDLHKSYVGAPTDGSAWVDSPRAPLRVLRGGSWHCDTVPCRSAWRYSGFGTDGGSGHIGFRVVLNAGS